MTRLGIITAYPREDWHSARLVAYCQASSVPAVVLDPLDFAVDCRGVSASGSELGSAGSERSEGAAEVSIRARGERIDEFDGFLLARALGDGGEPDLQIEIYRTMEQEGALLVNRIDPLLSALDKFRTSYDLARAGVPTPRVAIAQRLDAAEEALAVLGEVVAKPLYGSLGIGIERLCDASPRTRPKLERLLRRHGALYLQELVVGARGCRDVRAFVVGGRVEAAMGRVARRGEFRANLHQGGRALACSLTPALEELALRAATALGLDYAGVDIMETERGPVVIEVNGAPHWRGLLAATGRDMAEPIVDWACRRAIERGQPSAGSARAQA